MRKIIALVQTSFDGLISTDTTKDNADTFDWYVGGEETNMYVQNMLDETSAILLGRVTYEGFIQFWPKETGEFADRMNKTPKIVFAHPGKIKEVTWGKWDNISLIDQNVEEEVRKLKQQPGKDMVILASARLVQSFANADLIDEYRIPVHPSILGKGKRLFEDIGKRHKLKLVDVRTLDEQIVLLHYELVKE